MGGCLPLPPLQAAGAGLRLLVTRALAGRATTCVCGTDVTAGARAPGTEPPLGRRVRGRERRLRASRRGWAPAAHPPLIRDLLWFSAGPGSREGALLAPEDKTELQRRDANCPRESRLQLQFSDSGEGVVGALRAPAEAFPRHAACRHPHPGAGPAPHQGPCGPACALRPALPLSFRPASSPSFHSHPVCPRLPAPQ